MSMLRRLGEPRWSVVLFPLVVGVICAAVAIAMLTQGEVLIAALLAVFALSDFMLVSSDVRYLMAARSGGDDSTPR